MLDLETIAVILIVAVVIIFAARSIYRTLTGKAAPCDGNCAQCKLLDKCDSPRKKPADDKSDD